MPGLGQPISRVGRSPLELLQLSLLGSLLSTIRCLDHKGSLRSYCWESQQHPSRCNRAPSFKTNFLSPMKHFFFKNSRRQLYGESAYCTLCLKRSESLLASSSDPSTHIMLGMYYMPITLVLERAETTVSRCSLVPQPSPNTKVQVQ